ncbi:MAG: hypothetical protein ABW110_13420 [Steroidobacteraceae bacterium]
MLRILLAIVFALIAAATTMAYDAQPRQAVSLAGSWVVNAAASDDLDKLVSGLVAKEEKELRRWRQRMEEEDRFSVLDSSPDTPASQHRRAAEDEFKRMIGAANRLEIGQDGAKLEMRSDLDVRRFEAGSSSQVSMRNGDIADSRVGWDGDWFVIDRKVPRGAREVEKLRLISKTGQLEYVVQWSGDTELSGVKLRRIFDKAASDGMPTDPAAGPVR